MSKYFKLFLLSLYFLIHIFAIKANDTTKLKIGILPTMYYTPETKIGLGGLFYSYFKTDKLLSETKKSNTQSFFSYTLKKQFVIQNDYQIWLKKNKYFITWSADYSRFPQLFFGVGNNTKLSDEIMLSFDMIKIQNKIFKKIYKNIYGGFIFNYQKLYNQDVKLVDNAMCMEVFGNMGYHSKGFGPEILIDNRDNPLNPKQGYYLEMSLVDYKRVFANSNMFTSVTLDLRKYHTFFEKITWNSNVYFSFNEGQVPYKMLPEIGGSRFSRGHYIGRFRDKNMFVFQNELRMKVYKRAGIAVFGGLSNVAKNREYLATNQMHYSIGAGLRYKISKYEDTNLRIDVGFTKDSEGLYIVFAEAF